MQTVLLFLEEAAAHSDPGLAPYIIAGIGALAFTAFALVTWSYRDVAHRHSSKPGSDQNLSGHH